MDGNRAYNQVFSLRHKLAYFKLDITAGLCILDRKIRGQVRKSSKERDLVAKNREGCSHIWLFISEILELDRVMKGVKCFIAVMDCGDR